MTSTASSSGISGHICVKPSSSALSTVMLTSGEAGRLAT
jgi:hypothetical protein